MFSLSGNWLKWRRGRQKAQSQSESVFNVCGEGAVWVCVCLRVCAGWEAETRRGRSVMEGQVPCKVSHVCRSSWLLWAKLKSYQISRGLICSSDWKATDTFEHIFLSKESFTVFTEGQGQTSALPAWRNSFLKHCLASCCYFCVHSEGRFTQREKKFSLTSPVRTIWEEREI